MSNWSSRSHAGGRLRRDAREAWMKVKIGTGRIERQQQQRIRTNNKTTALRAAVAAAAMLAFLPFCKPLTSLDGRLAKYILVPSRQSAMGLRSSSPVESRLPRDREDPCSFRTRLVDPVADSDDANIGFESTDNLDAHDLHFDDSLCVSVGRSTGKFRATPGLPIKPSREHGQAGDSANMEAMNMPFWNLPRRQQWHTHTHHQVEDAIPDDDDMSIISNISLIPTYFPSDIMKQQQQQQRPRHRALLIKRLIRTKARAARQSMRELKRTCRDAVGNVFVVAEAGPYRPPKCVAVGSTY
ncbi:hypothetical protein N658DRAFT_511948 [Parathielavia hyrcaniae]|uniref:Uncharacterized protein n=1 Tax=Parathielavia hyrcaniae TaxID=113614 RepID=A0AAN6QEI9_9PEZI|nr:hypothetical protein N658DRAFT_511948 [Parathielavia hyrcaniae]